MATDEEVAVRLFHREQPCVAQALREARSSGASWMRCVGCRSGPPLYPWSQGLELPRLAIEERATVQLWCGRPLCLASRM